LKAKTLKLFLTATLMFAAACTQTTAPAVAPATQTPAISDALPLDPHSFARPAEAKVTHLSLDVSVDFAKKQIAGTAALDFENHNASRLVLDTRDLTIRSVRLDDGSNATWRLGAVKATLGAPLEIDIKPTTKRVSVDYASSPEAGALQWLDPVLTAGKQSPFLLSQSQSILARTWVPIQDTPSVRFTYDATVRVPRDLMALMSAENPTQKNADGIYRFRMPQPIPAYLLAIAVGDLTYKPLGPISGVYAEPAVIDRAVDEFVDLPKMIQGIEESYGPYRWGRYDLLVLPPSFPFGGMENPRLSFLTPTILAGDRSLVSVVTHELAHSWSGNLVTNATWNDFWLNEGFTTYIEHRMAEKLYGRDYAEMTWGLSRDHFAREIGEVEPKYQSLKVDLSNVDPDEFSNELPYNKGSHFLRLIEQTVGREAFDAYLRSYFDRFAFKPMTTEIFLADIRANLFSKFPGAEEKIGLQEWIYAPGMPANTPVANSDTFARIERQADAFIAGGSATAIDASKWSTYEYIHFVQRLPATLGAARMAELDQHLKLSNRGNYEILQWWLEKAIQNDYRAADPAIERFLTSQGRRKFLMAIYKALVTTPHGKELALSIYEKARPSYHPVSQATIDEIVGYKAPAR
jgi:leukotriene-A4 hydrolase